METARKITVEVPPELLEKAQRAIGAGITVVTRDYSLFESPDTVDYFTAE